MEYATVQCPRLYIVREKRQALITHVCWQALQHSAGASASGTVGVSCLDSMQCSDAERMLTGRVAVVAVVVRLVRQYAA